MERFRLKRAFLLLLLFLLCQSLDLSACLNDEGRILLRFRDGIAIDPYGALSTWIEGTDDHCSWFGVECSDDGRVVSLNLKDLLLEGMLTPKLGNLINLKSLIFHNNSLCGTIPKEIGQLQKLEILDLGHNNFSGPFPSEIGSILSLQILVLKNNKHIGNIPSELQDLSVLSELLLDEKLSSSKSFAVTRKTENATIRRLLREASEHKGNHHIHQNINMAPASAPSSSPSSSPSPPSSPSPSPSPSPSASAAVGPSSHFQSNSPAFPTVSAKHLRDRAKSSPPLSFSPPSGKKHKNIPLIVFLSVATGSLFLVALSVIYCSCCRLNEVVTVMPWKTGLSGQLQKAFVTGVPSLKRSELESACEDFSNVIGSLSDCILYKGTLSSGVEIAVTYSTVTSAKDWSDHHEAQFRKKISVLSKVNHKNFMNLIGYCEEEKPFTRMMVYEYAPNGTLFEYLHINEADHLDWAARLRIIMGIAYSLNHMHQLNPPIILRNLSSSSIYLCEDYAAKISDLPFWNEKKESDQSFESLGVLDEQLSTQEGNVYKFGIILLEIISGRLPFSEDDGLLVLWASSHLNGRRPLLDMVDITLESFNEEDVAALCKVIKLCIKADPKKRPTMAEVVIELRKITAMTPDAVSPKLSPLWWAELEIISTESSSLE